MFSVPGLAKISAVPTGNSKNSGVPTGNRIPPGNQAWAMTSEFCSRPSLEKSLTFIFSICLVSKGTTVIFCDNIYTCPVSSYKHANCPDSVGPVPI